jgi:hypothetical protein
MDGFEPYNSDSTAYSCWLVFVISYNLAPNKYLNEGFIFLALVILGPKEPKEANKYIFVFIDGRAERTVAKDRCI